MIHDPVKLRDLRREIRGLAEALEGASTAFMIYDPWGSWGEAGRLSFRAKQLRGLLKDTEHYVRCVT